MPLLNQPALQRLSTGALIDRIQAPIQTSRTKTLGSGENQRKTRIASPMPSLYDAARGRTLMNGPRRNIHVWVRLWRKKTSRRSLPAKLAVPKALRASIAPLLLDHRRRIQALATTDGHRRVLDRQMSLSAFDLTSSEETTKYLQR
jgi:hypothetical protein